MRAALCDGERTAGTPRPRASRVLQKARCARACRQLPRHLQHCPAAYHLAARHPSAGPPPHVSLSPSPGHAAARHPQRTALLHVALAPSVPSYRTFPSLPPCHHPCATLPLLYHRIPLAHPGRTPPVEPPTSHSDSSPPSSPHPGLSAAPGPAVPPRTPCRTSGHGVPPHQPGGGCHSGRGDGSRPSGQPRAARCVPGCGREKPGEGTRRI